MTDAPDDGPGYSFGGFRIEGLDDPLAPHAEPEHVEELDPDPAPLIDAVEHDVDRLPWFGATPWSGPSDQEPGTRRISRVIGAVAVGTIAVFAAALALWRLVA